MDSHPLIHLPIGFSLLSENKKINWRFETVPQQQMNGRRGYHPRGRVLGGSSSINAMVYIRGTAADYDRWAEAGATGWSYQDVLPYFRKSESQERGEDQFHGTGGPLSVSDLRYKNPLSLMFMEAARQLGLPANDDFNGASQEGVGFYQVTQREARRCSAAAAYLAPVRDRANLAVVTRAQVEKIVIDGKPINFELISSEVGSTIPRPFQCLLESKPSRHEILNFGELAVCHTTVSTLQSANLSLAKAEHRWPGPRPPAASP